MDQLARDEIGAAAAVHSELGREYDQAVAESLVDRIGAEIDRRVDARIGKPQGKQVAPRRGSAFASVLLAMGSTITGAITSVAILDSANFHSSPNAMIFLIVIIWVAIGGINISFNRSR